MRRALIEDGQIKDRSFKAVAFRIVEGLTKKRWVRSVTSETICPAKPFGDSFLVTPIA